MRELDFTCRGIYGASYHSCNDNPTSGGDDLYFPAKLTTKWEEGSGTAVSLELSMQVLANKYVHPSIPLCTRGLIFCEIKQTDISPARRPSTSRPTRTASCRMRASTPPGPRRRGSAAAERGGSNLYTFNVYITMYLPNANTISDYDCHYINIPMYPN